MGKFCGVQFSQKASLQSFCGLIFADEMLHPHLFVNPASRCICAWRKLAKTCEKVGQCILYIRRFEGEMAQESHAIEAMVRCCHVYKEIWLATVGEDLTCMREVGNYRNPFAVAVEKSGVVISHVPRKIVGVLDVFKIRWDYQL